MASPTDRGIAFVGSNEDGTSNVYVACGVDASAKPQDVVAVHFRLSSVVIEPEVAMVAAGAMRRSAAPVHVWADDDRRVHIRAARGGLGTMAADLAL
ncbi:hypothetical protein [Nonomuraea insulae]|uniref:Uncharacterized protein n=1 Tax=Nonomuraea insulae TaxID=1616787 RepID=A0ABW1CEV5_9ACTN